MIKTIDLSKREREEARRWRIEKCGEDSFESLFEKFKYMMSEQNQSKKK